MLTMGIAVIVGLIILLFVVRGRRNMKGSSPFWMVLAATAIPIMAVSIISAAGAKEYYRHGDINYTDVWIFAAVLWGIAGGVGIVLGILKEPIAKGIGVGIAISFPSLVASFIVHLVSSPYP